MVNSFDMYLRLKNLIQHDILILNKFQFKPILTYMFLMII